MNFMKNKEKEREENCRNGGFAFCMGGRSEALGSGGRRTWHGMRTFSLVSSIFGVM